MKLEFHPEAELELIEAAEYCELQVSGLGERFEAGSDVQQIFCSRSPKSEPPPMTFSVSSC